MGRNKKNYVGFWLDDKTRKMLDFISEKEDKTMTSVIVNLIKEKWGELWEK